MNKKLNNQNSSEFFRLIVDYVKFWLKHRNPEVQELNMHVIFSIFNQTEKPGSIKPKTTQTSNSHSCLVNGSLSL